MAISQITNKSITDATITADDIASGAVEGAMTTQIGGRRNLVINGAMQVAQRGTSETGWTASNAPYLADRFVFNGRSGTIGTHTLTNSTDAPDGFANSIKLECTTADASFASNEYIHLVQKIEAYNCQQLKFGTSGAESFTVSFWVKSNKTGTYILEIQGTSETKEISQSYTVDASNTWEYKTLTFVGDTATAITDGNSTGLKCNWWLAAGPDYSSGTLNTGWATASNTNRAVGQVNIADTVGNTWQITGVQLEVGSVATPFEHRSYTDEYLACSRYYQRLGEIAGGASAQYEVLPAVRWGLNTLFTTVLTPVTMRANPTPSGSAGDIGDVFGNGSTDPFTVANVNVQSITNRGVVITIGLDFNPTGTYAYVLYINDDKYLELDAEL